MKRKIHIQALSAQIMLEYLILTILIAFLVFSALNFKQNGSIGNSTIEQAQEYYKDGYKLIANETGGVTNGAWCAWGKCLNGYRDRSCACPRPALGG